LKENYNKINWSFLSANKSLDAMIILKENIDKIN
jgi:hypothetical protein